ncbi:MAG TPA: hypothetical protein DIT64_16870 [Verrucomicrobiales bacterium]|nr:hypothetical protein [Verrucomicrobiales bacterium]HCN75773.1 hypothetical protein [Verrucomicrobiales bacterium]HRJ10566.1 hypothetical protein [Prosthecobacter sp.]HRK16575.1 hypothetical protein [Prosthecobacter sp.]
MAKFVNTYLDEDLIIYRGLQRGGAIGKGYNVEMPDTENTDAPWLMALEDNIRVLLRLIRPELRLQVAWSVDSDYRKELERYKSKTEELGCDKWSLRAREERYRRYDRKIRNHMLRREHLQYFFTSRIQGRAMGGGRQYYEELLLAAKREQAELEEALRQQLGSLGGRVSPMTDMEHFETFYRYFNPSAFENEALKLEDIYDPTKSVCEMCFNSDAAPVKLGASTFKMDGFYQGICVMKTLPKFTYIGMMRLLTQLDILDYQVVVNIEAGDVEKDRVATEAKVARLERGKITPSLEATLIKLRTRIRRLTTNEVVPYRMHLLVRVWDRDEATCASKLSAIKNSILKLGGAQAYEPTLPTSVRNYWQLCMPGWTWANYNDFKLYVEDVNLADLLPISSTPVGDLEDAEAIYDGPRGALVGCVTFVGKKGAQRPEHGIMFGASGAGKSVFTIDLLTQTAPYFDYTAIVEEGLSYNLFTRLYGCTPIIVQPNGNLTFNYFDTRGLPLSPDQLGDATAVAHLMAGPPPDTDKDRIRQALLAKQVERLYVDQFETWANRNADLRVEAARRFAVADEWRRRKMPQGTVISDAWLDFHSAYQEGETEANDLFGMSLDEARLEDFLNDPVNQWDHMSMGYTLMKPEDMPTHSQFVELLNLESRQRRAHEDLGLLRMLLEPWSRTGRYGAIMDGVNNVNLKGKVVHFELSYIPESAKELRTVAAFLITNDLRKEIMSRPRSTRKRVILEELSAFLAMPDGDRITREYYERMRKYSCWVFSIIQQFQRIKDHPVRSSVVGNSRVMFMLKQPDQRDVQSMSEGFRIPEVTKRQVTSFPDPSEMKNDPFASFVYYHEATGRPRIAIGRHQASKEMILASATSGEAFERQNQELKEYGGDAYKMILSQAKT